MGTVMTLDISMWKIYKAVYDDKICLLECKIEHTKLGFKN